MNAMLNRTAITLCILWFIPLLIWLLASFQSQQWQVSYLQLLLQQAIHLVLLLQAMSISLLYAQAGDFEPSTAAGAAISVLLSPSPLVLLAVLTQSLTFMAITRGYLFLLTIMLLSVVLHYLLTRLHQVKTRGSIHAFVHLALAMQVWNYRAAWQAWIGS